MLSVREEIAKNLLYYRKKNNITQRQLAERLGVKHNSVSAWENCTNSVDIDTLFKICELFNVSANDMYGVFSNADAEQYTQEEKRLIDDYRILNNEGKAKVLDSIDDLIKSGKYKKEHTDTGRMGNSA